MQPIFYKAKPISELRLSPRNKKLMDDLMNAEKSFSTINGEIAKEAYDAYENEAPILKRAYAFKAMMEKMPIYIREGELLVGNRSAGIGVMPRLPEEWNFKENMRARRNDARYEAMGLYTNFESKLSSEVHKAQSCLLAGYPAGSGDGFGHILADYGMIVKEGALSLAGKAGKQAKLFEAEGKTKEAAFCKASEICCLSFAALGGRYAKLAREEAQHCTDEQGKAELLRIAEVCERVPSQPAACFYDALQAFYLCHMACLVEQNAGSISIGQFDRLLWKYYIEDINQNKISVELAEELVESFCIKIMENALWPRDVVMYDNCAIGGCDAEGKDASNDLTWMMLDCIAKTGSPHPLVSFRWHPSINSELWLRVVEIVGLGHGLPALFSDIKMINILESWKVPLAIAADYGVVGCVEPGLSGLLHGQTMGGHVNLLLCLELAMNNGKLFSGGEDVGPATGYLYDFSSIEELWDAYLKQLTYACELNRQAVMAVAESQQELYGYPFMSSLMEDAVALGKDLSYGARWNYATVCITALTNVSDSFTVLEYLIEEKKRCDFKFVHDALKNNFSSIEKNFEKLREEILSLDICFGNGNERAREWHAKVCEAHTEIFETEDAPRNGEGSEGGAFVPGLWTTTWHVSQGKHTGASIDGRLSGEPLADSVGPLSHRIMHGPTAAAMDVAAINSTRHWPGGYVWNARFSKELFKDRSTLEKITQYITTYFKSGGMQVQVNTYSSELLKRAQREPEKYRDLVVRVAGFSAYFAALSKDVQNEIISRAELISN